MLKFMSKTTGHVTYDSMQNDVSPDQTTTDKIGVFSNSQQIRDLC
jgi:hypothetical protein